MDYLCAQYRLAFNQMIPCFSYKNAELILKLYVCMICQVLGFGEYIEEVYSAYEQHKIESMVIVCIFAPFSYLAFCNVNHWKLKLSFLKTRLPRSFNI